MSDDKLKRVKPIELLSAERFDISAKYLYARFKHKGINSNWHENVYLEHIKIFNGYIETDGTGKCGVKAFLESFDETIASIMRSGFDKEESIVPVNNAEVLIDGAHRVAAALLSGSNVNTELKDIGNIKYDSCYFLKNGLKEKWADPMALEYCYLKNNTFVVILYPAAVGKKEDLQELLSAYGKTIYKKSIKFSKNGAVNLIKNIYHSEKWLGDNKSNYSGARDKANYCFSSTGYLDVYLYESDLENVLELKREIRNLYGVSNHSVHINDTHEESIDLCQLLFNKNSIDYLNFSPICVNLWVEKLIREYKSILSEKREDLEDYCLDGGAVLALHGIRNTRDLDYISSSRNDITSGFKEISCHNNEDQYFNKALDEIIYNPDNHFYLNGVKVITLETLREFKCARGEKKDIDDVELIDAYIKARKNGSVYVADRRNFITELKNIKSHARLFVLKCRFYTYNIYYKVKRLIS